MQAITTKFISPTNTRPARIKAACERGSLTMQWPHGLTTDEAHAHAAHALCEKFADEDAKPDKYGTPRESNPWLRPRVSGTIIGGTYVHVFTDAKATASLVMASRAYLAQSNVSNRAALRESLNAFA